MSRLQAERYAVITGASKGLGKTLAGFLAGQGYTLLLTARGNGELEEVAANLRALGAKVVVVAGDVRDAGHREALAEVVTEWGRLDLLVNNASTLGITPLPELKEYPLDALGDVFDVNVLAPLGLVQSFLPALAAANGLVVNVSSDAAVGGYETWGAYGASKAALDLVSKTLANELKNMGVGVVSVDPGDMRTDMQQEAFPDEDISDRPLPEVTIPFWAWLLGRESLDVSGQRYEAQAELWETAYEVS